jgi:tripartite-type tricarboxylate transporter receptor subunit TctC
MPVARPRPVSYRLINKSAGECMRRRFALAIAAAAAILWGHAVLAQGYPNRPVRIIAPFPAGGLADVLARALGDEMTKSLGQPVVVENRAGAGGNVGAELVANAPPDGYTLMLASAGILSANEFLYAKMAFAPATAFAPITLVADMPMLLVVHPKTGVSNVREFVAKAKAWPNSMNFGSPGNGTTGHLGLAGFLYTAGIQIVHIPYRGAAPAVQDLLGGQIDGLFENPPIIMEHIKAGSIRPLGVAAKQRLATLPDVPTMAEAGSPYEASSWFGLAAPAKTAPEIIARLNKEAVAALRTPATLQRFATSGARLVGNTPEEFQAFITSERDRWGTMIRAAGIKLD